MIKFKVDNLKNMNTRLTEFAEYLRLSGVDDDAVFAGKLVSCELITNVIRHGGDEAEFTGTLADGNIVITVYSESLKDVELNRPAPDVFAESGRGLYIVRKLCHGEISRESGCVKVIIRNI